MTNKEYVAGLLIEAAELLSDGEILTEGIIGKLKEKRKQGKDLKNEIKNPDKYDKYTLRDDKNITEFINEVKPNISKVIDKAKKDLKDFKAYRGSVQAGSNDYGISEGLKNKYKNNVIACISYLKYMDRKLTKAKSYAKSKNLKYDIEDIIDTVEQALDIIDTEFTKLKY